MTAGSLLLAALLVCGCKHTPVVSKASTSVNARPIMALPSATGLEVHWWLTDDAQRVVSDRLSRYLETPLPADPIMRRAWTNAGLRLVRAPLGDVLSIEGDLPTTRLRYRDWVGWPTSWTEIFRGRRAGGAAPLIVGARPRSFPPGTLRILARAWPGPGPVDHHIPSIHLDLAVQLQHDVQSAPDSMLDQPRIVPEEERGTVFRSLTLNTAIEPGWVWIITADAPSQQWALPADGSPSHTTRPDVTQHSDAEPDEATSPPAAFGPPVSGTLTVGQAMMTASTSASPDLKVILILIPRAPERYRLLPEVASTDQ